MKRFAKSLSILLAASVLTACADQPMGPSDPGGQVTALSTPGPFEPADFAWSTRRGGSSIEGVLTYRGGGGRYTCDGGDVILTPETAWSRRRMIILYGSASAAAVPVSIVRARTPGAPAGDIALFARKTTCDASNHFSFGGLPDGSWFVITVAKPADGAGETVAITRRVETRGGVRSVTLY
jgi:hypothetical protein